MNTKVLIKKSFNLIFVFILLFLLQDLIFSQDLNKKNNQKAAESLTIKLKQKVLLTDQQTKQVESILLEYLNSDEKGGKNLSETKSKIESLLDNKQKVKYQIIKDDWWEELNKTTTN